MAQRQHGYRVTIRAFFPVNPKDLDDTTAKADLVRRVTAGDLALLGGAEFEKGDQLWVSRQAPMVATARDLPGEEQTPVDVNGEDLRPEDTNPEDRYPAAEDEQPAGTRSRRKAA